MSVSKDGAAIASLVDGNVVGDPDIRVSGVASLADATSADVSFLGNPRYRDRVLPSRAAIVLVPESFTPLPPEGRAWVVCNDPSAAFSKVVSVFAPPPVQYPPGCHSAAVVHPDACVPSSVHVGPHAVIEAGATVGDRSVICAGTYVGESVRIGEDCLIYPNVTIRERCLLGNRVIVHPGTVIGSDGFGYESGPAGHTKIPQVGIVQIDDDVEIGAQVAVDRARFGRTWIQQGTKVDNLVQIAHNVIIGPHCFLIAQVGISGSTEVGTGVILAGQAGIAGHLHIGDRAIVMAQSGISKDVPAGKAVFGTPAMERRQFAKLQSHLKGLDHALKSLRQLQETVEDLKTRLDKES